MVNSKGFRGFTLAEVLITLVIIGVIAAMTIPTLINKTNKQEDVSRLKKTYSTLAQATNKIIADEGNPKASIGGWATSTEAVYNMYKKYLSKAKDCANGQGCFANEYYKHLNGGNYKNLDTSAHHRIVLSDGTLVLFDTTNNTCVRDWDGNSDSCAQIWVDINGVKGPNTAGRDWFSFLLKENGLYPRGCNNPDCTGPTVATVDTIRGLDCTCQILRTGEMNY